MKRGALMDVQGGFPRLFFLEAQNENLLPDIVYTL